MIFRMLIQKYNILYYIYNCSNSYNIVDFINSNYNSILLYSIIIYDINCIKFLIYNIRSYKIHIYTII